MGALGVRPQAPLGWGYSFMPTEPSTKRCYAFVDGQNLFNAAKDAFGYHFPNYDILALVKAVCDRESLELKQAYFYTGMPVLKKDKPRHDFWARKLAVMGRQGVKIFSRDDGGDFKGSAPKVSRSKTSWSGPRPMTAFSKDVAAATPEDYREHFAAETRSIVFS